MILYVTKEPERIKKEDCDFEITITDNENQVYNFIEYALSNTDLISLDIETSGLDPYKHNILLIGIGDNKNQLIIDTSTVDPTDFILCFKNRRLLGHNIKFDLKFLFVKYPKTLCLKHFYDTMIVDQRLFKGLNLRYSLNHLAERHLGYQPGFMHKEIRLQFISKNYNGVTFRQIEYLSNDLKYLPLIVEKQTVWINKLNQNFLLYEIEFPLIKVLAKAEIRGILLDNNLIRENIKQNEKELFEIELELDKEFHYLRDTLSLRAEDKLAITGGKYDRVRKKTVNNIISLFDDIPNKSVNVTNEKAYINYSSTKDLIYILGRLNQPLPTSFGSYEIPKFNNKGDIINSYLDFTTNEKEIDSYLMDYYDSPIRKFLELLFIYREISGNLSKYGEEFIANINKHTGKIHTIYRQTTAENGRLQSGGGKKEPDKFQSQNIPRDNRYRKMFIAGEGRKIITADLSGAEVVIMADFANDQKLFDLAMNGDIHGHLATAGWRAVYKLRADYAYNSSDPDIKAEFEELDYKANNFTVSKKENVELRQRGKNATFGFVYGMGLKKASKTLGIKSSEAKVYGDACRKELPLTYEMVNYNAKLALMQGYIIFNTRTNSRLWFEDVKYAKETNRQLTFEEEVKISGKAKNCPISGTQADIIKEAMVLIDNILEEKQIDAHLILQVHDELVYDSAENVAENVASIVVNAMRDTANKYLKHLKMDATVQIENTWLK